MKKAQAHGYKYEKKMANKRGKHIGGPGQPDYKRGNMKGEVKATAQPLHKGTVRELVGKKIKEIESERGFTEPAIKYAKEKRIALRKQGKKI